MLQRRINLNLGEYKVTNREEEIVCYGLGSCVGLFLYDRVNKIAAAAHVVLSGDLEKHSTHNANTAFFKLLQGIRHLGGNLNTLRAQIVGGANIFNTELDVGRRNVESLQHLIREHKIYLASQEVGGKQGRTAIFNTKDGSLTVSSVNRKINS
jgi:chemotaxis protein CheD